VQVAVKNQDNREHDIFDSDNYLQYHRGDDRHHPGAERPQSQELLWRQQQPGASRGAHLASRKPIASSAAGWSILSGSESIQRHGYKGALELAATVIIYLVMTPPPKSLKTGCMSKQPKLMPLTRALQEFFSPEQSLGAAEHQRAIA